MANPDNSDGGISSAAGALNDPQFVEDLRRRMVRFATLQLSDPSLAEDAVQEAFIGALRGSGSFAGRAAYRSWVFGILRHKIADQLRAQTRYAAAPVEDAEPDPVPDGFFEPDGHWTNEAAPADWGDPHASLRDDQFWRVFEACLDHLPGQQARVFMMREFVELESPEICRAVGISTSNLNVSLHRARLRLRGCLEQHWFGEETVHR
ncbi:MAG: sigma-70 family RNA polymerase sigma factor [Steroidobacteraceae bacterium]